MATDTYLLVHGAWHTGAELQETAEHLRARGHIVHCPTLAGNRVGDDRARTGLEDAAQSLVTFIEQQDLGQVRLVGHSYAGMVISRVADLRPERFARLVYVNAFVPLPGECLNDLVPPHYTELFDSLAAQDDASLMLPFAIWREAFINDADLALARQAFERLNPHPYKTFQDPIALSQPMAACTLPKSYVNCRMDCALPHSLGWHPRLSERLGLFRYVECTGSHEAWFTEPAALAAAIEQAGRD